MKSTLVTGGTGLVGSAIHTNNITIKLSSSDCDLRNWDETLSTFLHLKPSYVIHCAAR